MNNSKLNHLLLWLIISLLCIKTSFAQGFDYMISLPEINEKGFHKIMITPNISAKTADNFADFRLYDQQKREVPYIIRKDFVSKQHRKFIPYQLIAKSTPGDTATELIVKNHLKSKINNLSIFLNNAEVSKQIIISGSDDQKQWFAVKQNYNISGIANQNNVTELNTIYFPLSNYTYYKILINDKHSLPVKVLQAGYYQDSISYGEEVLLKTPQITRTENNKEHLTQIHLTFDTSYEINKISINVTAPTLYQRPMRIYAVRNNNGKIFQEMLQETTLSATSNNQIFLDQVQAQHLILEISNDNNPLLQIDHINCYLRSQFIIAYLEQKGSYTLKFGNKNLNAPVYDLAYFEEVIPSQIPVLETKDLNIIKSPDKPVTKTIEPPYYNKKTFLWAVIIGVAILLLLITSKMLNEMNKKKN